MAEIVYVLTNEAMEGLVKIGRTTTSIEQRVRELDNTSVPLPFQCFYAGEVKDSAFVESRLHQAFISSRVRGSREFFRIDPNQVKAAIQIADPIDVTPRLMWSSMRQTFRPLRRRLQMKSAEVGYVSPNWEYLWGQF